MTCNEKLDKAFDILMQYDKKELAIWLLETLSESALDEMIANEEEAKLLDQ